VKVFIPPTRGGCLVIAVMSLTGLLTVVVVSQLVMAVTS
jgi:hypothetical protein